MEFGVAQVIGITVICYLAAEACKASSIDNKWIPIICGVLGGVLGIAGMYIMPDYPAQDYINATAVGIVSGLAATGANQVFKQITNK